MNFAKLALSGLMTLAVCIPSVAQSPFSLSGKIDGMPDSIRIKLIDVEDPNENFVELAQTNPKGGAFELKGEMKAPTMCKLFFQKYNPDQDQYRAVMSIRMMIDPSKLTMAAPFDFDSLLNMRDREEVMTVSGSKIADQYLEYREFIKDAERKRDNAANLSASKYFESNDNPDTTRKYNAIKKIAEKEFLEAKQAFIAAHPDYNISAYLTQRELENIFKYNAAEIDAMSDLVKVCPDTARVSTVEKRRNFAHKYALGMNCPAFQATTPEGEVVDFKSKLTPGKYTFIDFWASWCGPCRQAIPHVKELHKKYGDKLDVFSVSVDENEKAWRKAMEKEQMAWQQFHLKGNEQVGNGSKAFFLTSIPRLILLDDKGNVVCSTHNPDEVSEILASRLGE